MKALPLSIFALASISALGCSPAADPIGKANAHFQITFSTLPDVAGCSLPSIGGIGSPPPSLPSGDGEVSSFGQQVTDGEDIGSSGSYEIECTVTKGGKINIEMTGSNDSISAPASSGEVALNVDATISTSEGTGTGSIMVRTTESGATQSESSVPCQLKAVADGDDFAISAGEARFTFECERAKTPLSSDPSAVCKTLGAVWVRDCLEE